jgi:hypothetical protein
MVAAEEEVVHQDDMGGKDKGANFIVDPAESKKRSWIQKRSVEIYLEMYGEPGTLVDNQKWAPAYQQARKEWDEVQRRGKQEAQEGDGDNA